jgi:hypothetical protein
MATAMLGGTARRRHVAVDTCVLKRAFTLTAISGVDVFCESVSAAVVLRITDGRDGAVMSRKLMGASAVAAIGFVLVICLTMS